MRIFTAIFCVLACLTAVPSGATAGSADWRSLMTQGEAASARGDWDAAQTSLRAAVELARAGANPKCLALSLAAFSRFLEARGRIVEAAALLEERLKLRRRELGPRHLDLAQDLYGAAGFYVEHRNLGAAIEHLEEVVLVDTAAFGPDDPLIGDSLFYIAGLYRELDRLDDAARAYQAALAVYEKFLPSDHADIGRLLTGFAQVLEQLGDPVRAAEMTARAAVTKFGRPDG